MEIERQKLLDALKNISLATNNKGLVESSSFIYFSSDSVKAFNGEICIEAKIKTEIDGGINAKEILGLISKLEGEKIKAEVEEENLKIISGKTIAKLKMEKVKLPEIKIPEEKFWNTLPDNFCEGINFVKTIVPASDIVPELSQLFVEGNKMISCDNLRAIKFFLPEIIRDSFTISKNVCEILSQFDIVKYAKDKGWIHFKDSFGNLFSCVFSSSQYPAKKVNSLFDKEGAEIKLPEDFAKVIERVASIVLGSAQDKLICLTFGKSEIICKGKSDSGYVREKTTCENSGIEFSAYVNPEFLIFALKEKCKIKLAESFMLIEGENFKHIISLQIKLDK